MDTQQVTTPIGALAVGIAAPLIVERLTRTIPLTDPVQDTVVVPADEWQRSASGSELNGQRIPAGKQHPSGNDTVKADTQGDQPGRVGD